MPNSASAETAIQLMRQAAEANGADPFRVGSLIQLPTEGDLFMTGDLHGNLRNYQKIVELAALQRNQKRHLILHEILHALTPTPDGCDLSFQVLEMAARLKIFFPDQVHFLMGNHDLGELLKLDILKGSHSSLKGLDQGLAAAYGEWKDAVRTAYLEFLLSLPLAASTGTGIFISHSIPEARYLTLFEGDVFRKSLEAGSLSRNSFVYRLVWGRKFDQETADRFAALVGANLLLCGHQPTKDGYQLPNSRQLILDSKDGQGCYLLIPLDQPLSLNELVERVRRLSNNQRVV